MATSVFVCIRFVIFAALSNLTNDALPNHRQERNEIRTAISVDFSSDDAENGHVSSTRAQFPRHESGPDESR